MPGLVVGRARGSSPLDRLALIVAAVMQSVGRFAASGRFLEDRRIRKAWAAHEAGDEYMSLEQVNEWVARLLPGAAVHRHWFWTYTVHWEKPWAARPVDARDAGSG